MSRIMDQGSRGSGVSCPETVSRIAHIVSTHRMACRAHASIASLYAPAMALHCHATMQSMGNISNTLILRNHGSWDGYPDDHISAMSCLACHDHECTSLIACVAIACLERACIASYALTISNTFILRMMVSGMVTRMTTSQPCHVSPCMTTSVHP